MENRWDCIRCNADLAVYRAEAVWTGRLVLFPTTLSVLAGMEREGALHFPGWKKGAKRCVKQQKGAVG